MQYKKLYIFLEGDDDERFFQKIVKPKFEEKYDLVIPRKYAQVKNEKVGSFLKSIKAMSADYICVTDINQSPCVTGKKQWLQDKFKNIDKDKIIVVIKEIESWYLAGLDTTGSKNLGFSPLDTTDDITKERFNEAIPKKFDSRIDFMVEILKCFSPETAKQKNKSFKYFLEKYDC